MNDGQHRFLDFLVKQTPSFDEQIIADFARFNKPSLHLLPVDVRLLPNLLRRVYAASHSGQESVKGMRITRRRFRHLLREAKQSLMPRLQAWLKSLPKEQRKRERRRRWFVDGWVGMVEQGELAHDPYPSLVERWL